MSGGVPSIDTEPASTPATEWANQTKKAFSADTEMMPAISTGAVAGAENTNEQPPATELPGAYPAEWGFSEAGMSTGADGQKAGGVVSGTVHMAQEAIEKAMGYMPGDVNKAVHSAGQTASHYLPKSVVDTITPYLPAAQGTARASEHDQLHVASLPTKEILGTQLSEHQDGVGSLPGLLAETGATRLPDDQTPVVSPVGDTSLSAEQIVYKPSSASIAAQRALDDRGALPKRAAGTAETGFHREQVGRGLSGGLAGATVAGTATSLPTTEPSDAQPFQKAGGTGGVPEIAEKPEKALPEEGKSEGTKSGHPSEFNKYADNKLGAEGRRVDEDTKGSEASGDDATGRASGMQGFRRETIPPTVPLAIPPSTTDGKGAEGRHLDEDVNVPGVPSKSTCVKERDMTSRTKIPEVKDKEKDAPDKTSDECGLSDGRRIGSAEAGEQSTTARTEKKDKPGDEAKDKETPGTVSGAVEGHNKVRHEPTKVNTQAREWRTWQGAGSGPIGKHDVDLAEKTDDGDPERDALGLNDDGEAKDQVLQPTRSAHSDISEVRRTENTSSTAAASGGSPRKPKFMDRVRGEAKVLVGKLGGDPHKVDEGMKLKLGGR
ncbi:hypothetical protein FA95DRAFT_1604732 [Auriscalpium vulgare]|uniref:Uncharacterized protein n=1 Tax=Auriscalpium vulgare TaxID=40419 RepID=A0ACB8RXQ7_9AGAM|nr:hypothetical protein FA95DRAFT_1604732 [Auriscalpium vulgare]